MEDGLMPIKVDQYLFHPGCCGICRSSNLPTIDSGIQLDHYNDPNAENPGANNLLYICADCAINLAQMVLDSRGLELLRAGTAGALQSTIDDLTNSNVYMANRIEDLENALRVVKSIKPTPEASTTTKKAFKAVAADEVEI